MDYSFSFSTIWGNVSQMLTDPAYPMMLNNGLFWGVFIVFVAIFALLRHRKTQMMLFVIVFSLFFAYKGCGWVCLMMVFTAIVDWHLARCIAATTDRWLRRLCLTVSIACSLGIMVVFKYTDIAIVGWNEMVSGNFQPLHLVAPLGVSFYTFRTISYVVDVYKEKMPPVEGALDYVFYLTFFPVLAMGPIVRARDFMPQLAEMKPVAKKMLWGGLWLVMLGLLKKAVVADYIGQYTNLIFSDLGTHNGTEILMATLGYTMQIYCDFSGYSDMAIGVSAIMGFNVGINFDFPYRSRSVTEFWRRWHISLSFWLRDYVYIPLGGNRKGKPRQYLNLMITMLLGGLWHTTGVFLPFVVWGALHGAALCLHKMCLPTLKKINDTPPVIFLSWAVTFVFIIGTWVFFRSQSLEQAGQVFTAIFTDFHADWLPIYFQRGDKQIFMAMLLISFALHFVPKRVYATLQDTFVKSPWIVKLLLFMVTVQLVIQFANAEVQPFLYAQFAN